MNKITFFIALFLLFSSVLFAQVAINTDGSVADNSAMLDVKSAVKGMLIPRMTLAGRDAIVTPATGLLIFQTDNTPGFYYNSGTPASPAWVIIGGGTSAGWNLTGNIGTSSTNFVGTTDNVSLVFKVNNQPSGKIDPVTYNTSLGYKSLGSNISGHSNVAFGSFSLYQNTNRSNLVAIGDSALFNNGLGATTTLQGRHNTAVGSKALYANNIGQLNTAIGFRTLYSNTTGSNNTATGVAALFSNIEGVNNTANGSMGLHENTTGNGNTATGSAALFSNTEGNDNTADGSSALIENTTGEDNAAFGAYALATNTTGNNNTAIGTLALYATTTGSYNTATGFSALYNNSTGNYNIADGIEALKYNTTGSQNIAIGYGSLYGNKANSRNIAIGYLAMYSADDRTDDGRDGYNIAIGYSALRGSVTSSANTGRWNTAIGANSMYSNSSGNGNTAAGVSSLYSNTTGSGNAAFGDDALMANTTGTGNSAFGSWAMMQNTIGSYNTAVGKNALYNNIGASGMTCIGSGADAVSGYMDDATAIGLNAIVNANGKTRIGDIWQNTIEGQVGWSYPSDGRFKTNVSGDVQGIGFIMKLRPVTYNFESRKYQEFLVKNMPDSVKSRYLDDTRHPDINPILQSGFVAQEVLEAARAAGYDFDGVHVPIDENDNYSLVYSQFVVPLVKAVQEQQVIINDLKKENAEMKSRMDAIEIRLKEK